jgi:hypothetical protein
LHTELTFSEEEAYVALGDQAAVAQFNAFIASYNSALLAAGSNVST